MDDQNKNMILAAVLSFAVILVWSLFFFEPPVPPAETPASNETAADPNAPAAVNPDAALPPAPAKERTEILTETRRVPIETPRLSGSLSLKGGRLDDLSLKDFRETLEPDSENVVLFSPSGTEQPYFAAYGWLATNRNPGMATPDSNSTNWALESGDVLTPQSPVTLVWDNGSGLIFRRKIEVDDGYLFTVTQSVQNTSQTEVVLYPRGLVAKLGKPDTINFWVLHEGAVGAADGTSSQFTYEEGFWTPGMDKFELDSSEGAQVDKIDVRDNGWLGFTAKYWGSAVIPISGQPFTAIYKYISKPDRPEFQAEMRLPAVTVPAGETAEVSSHLFAGAKEVSTLEHYQESLKIERFDYMVDWGWFFFLTRPIFQILHWLYGQIGNMGWSIILLTLFFKTLLFPLAYKSYVSMSKMKKLQPEMQKIKERAGDDRTKLQQEMMALYKKERVNPASGCLPIVLQIPIFFSLYKVIFVTLELRQAPFILWIRDLSVPDPTSVINLFGLMPWAVPDAHSFLHVFSIGFFPILMGITMWMQQKLNPAPTDRTQAMIFAWMPWVFMFMLGRFASGLVIYWCANNILTFTQQYTIMRSQGVQVDFFGNVKRSFRRKKKKDA